MSQGPVAEPQQQAFAGMPQRLYAASPSRLLSWLDCPRRYRMTYLDRPRPVARPQRAHTSLGLATHNALRDYWDLAPTDRTPAAGAELVRRSWIPLGFRDEAQSSRWRERTSAHVKAYLQRHRVGVADAAPIGVERTVALKTPTIAVTGRVDRVDDRDGELVVVDYKTSRSVPTDDDARTSLALALYAVALSRMFRRPVVRVELHHVATGTVVAHEHTPESLARKVAEAESIARDLRAVDAEFAELGANSTRFEPRTTPLCAWCDLRAHCPTGQLMGAEKSSWAALDPD